MQSLCLRCRRAIACSYRSAQVRRPTHAAGSNGLHGAPLLAATGAPRTQTAPSPHTFTDRCPRRWGAGCPRPRAPGGPGRPPRSRKGRFAVPHAVRRSPAGEAIATRAARGGRAKDDAEEAASGDAAISQWTGPRAPVARRASSPLAGHVGAAGTAEPGQLDEPYARLSSAPERNGVEARSASPAGGGAEGGRGDGAPLRWVAAHRDPSRGCGSPRTEGRGVGGWHYAASTRVRGRAIQGW